MLSMQARNPYTSCHAAAPHLMSLETDGYAVFEGLLEGAQIDAILGALEAAPLPRSRAGSRHAMRHPAIAELARDSRLLGIARQALGPDAMPFKATLFDKGPEANWLVAWHQDTALPLRERRDVAGWGPWSTKDGILYARAPTKVLRRILALRVHLDDSTAENGPLRVLPGTHRHGVLSDDEVQRVSNGAPVYTCLVARGGVLAMRP
jgi:hypothetical protein